MHEENTTNRFPITILNYDQYEITDCVAILRRLESLEKKEIKAQDFKKYADRVESRINYLMFE